jgi:sulfonate transport system permease protein
MATVSGSAGLPAMSVVPWRGLVLPVLLAAAWSAAAVGGLGNPALLVPLPKIWSAGIDGFLSGELAGAVAATMGRTLAGWSIGVATGVALGLVLGLSATGRRSVAPTLHAARQIALFAWIPLLSAWFGNGEAMKIVLISVSAFFPALLHVEAGCRDVPEPYREVGRLFGYGRQDTILSIILPAAMPTILSGLELAFTSAWIGTIGAEYLIGTGYMNASADGIGALRRARTFAWTKFWSALLSWASSASR